MSGERERETLKDKDRKRKKETERKHSEIARVHAGFNRMCVRAGTK